MLKEIRPSALTSALGIQHLAFSEGVPDASGILA
jgi:hypothetical protein